MFVKYEVSVINHGNFRANLGSLQCTITRNNHKTIVQTKFSKFWERIGNFFIKLFSGFFKF